MNQRRDLRFWNRAAHLYGPFMKRWEGMYQEMAAEIGAYLSRDEDILELACGSGQLSFRLAHKARLWEATDYSPKMIAEARKRFAPAGCIFPYKTPQPYPTRRNPLTGW